MNARSLSPIHDLQVEVAKHFRVPIRCMTNRELSREAIAARHVGMFLARTLLGKGPVEIGRRFNRDHSTVNHGIRKVERDEALLCDASIILAKVEAEAVQSDPGRWETR